MPSEIERIRGDRALREMRLVKKSRQSNSDYERQTYGRNAVRLLIHLCQHRQTTLQIAESLGWHPKKAIRWIHAMEQVVPVQSDGDGVAGDPLRFWIDKADLRRLFGF